jgi:MFS superfamily sulfate permease-like transporter
LNFKGNKKEKAKFIILIISVTIIIIFPQQTLFPLILLYILTGLVSWIFRLNKSQSHIEQDEVQLESKD